MKPLIGITCNYDYRDTIGIASGMGNAGQDRNFLAGDYIYGIERAGGIPVIIPQYESFEDAKALLDRLDGIIISGGHDVGPENYGAFPKGYCGIIMPKRDAQDIAVVRYMLLEKKKPLLGICRGIQAVNVACGGTLYQDLEKEGGFEPHSGDKYPRNVGWHSVSLDESSRLHKIYGSAELRVNSFHHQAVKEPGKGFRITAYSSDGVPEAIEYEGESFGVAVQWHPEAMYDSKEQRKLLRALVEASCR